MVGGALGHGLVVKIVMLRTESSLLSCSYSTLRSTVLSTSSTAGSPTALKSLEGCIISINVSHLSGLSGLSLRHLYPSMAWIL